ncbi:MAG: hypothetical protein MZU97_24615 [Bacillus subtilis]|nr:hypothetical protein [Bacillus subtilis]
MPNDRILELIARASNAHLYHKDRLGVRLNTRLGQDKHNLGRLMGFAFGHKENGAPFSHMSVMYAYSLLRQRLRPCRRQSPEMKSTTILSDIERSRIYPGIPEYIERVGPGDVLLPDRFGVVDRRSTFVEQVFGAERLITATSISLRSC